MIITREKGMRMWGGGSGNTSVSGASSGGGFSLTVAEGEGTGNAYTDFTYESGTLTLNKATEFVTVDFFNKLFTAYDANGNVIAPNNTTPTLDNIKFKAGAWTEQYLSALGQNSSGGGGGGGIELSDVWQSLKTNTDDYQNQKINIAHIPDLSGTYATKTWVNQQGFVTSSGVTSVAMTVPTGLSVSGSPITSTGTLALTFTSGYSIPTTAKQSNWDTAYGWGNHATAGYASESSVTTLQGYFTNGVANTAAKLNTGSTTYSVWGQTYWENGVPKSVSNTYMSGVTNIDSLLYFDTTNSRIGIGTSNPSALLDINGYALATAFDTYRSGTTGYGLHRGSNIASALGTTDGALYYLNQKLWMWATEVRVNGALNVTGGITLTTTKKIYFGDTDHYLELDSTGFHFSHGVYSDSFVSALGSNSSGGGSGTFDEEAMWTALGTTISAKVIASSHIPNLSWAKITSGKPTTLSGYGISDAYTKTQVDNALGGYLPLSGGTLTGGLEVGGTLYTNGFAHMIKFDVDTSRAYGYGWWDTNSNTVASIVYHNTAQNIILNPVGSANAYSDAVGKYSLFIGNNKLTYNTYTILHSNNTYVSSGKGYINGTEITTISGNAATATKATQDGSGNTITSTYLPLSGGTMTNAARIRCRGFLTNETGGNSGMWKGSAYTSYLGADDVVISTNTISSDKIVLVAGYVGIGTYTPAYKLDVDGDVRADNFRGSLIGNAATATTLQTPRTIWGQNFNGSADIPTTAIAKMPNVNFKNYNDDDTAGYCGRGSDSTNNIYLWAYSGNQLILGANGSAGMYISTSNNVGIGTASPSTKLHVSGSVFANGYETYRSGSTFYGLYKGNSITGSLTASDGCLYYPSLKIWMYATEVRVNGAIYGTGEITAASDARKKNIISNTKFSVKDIASARSILYEWNDGRDSGQVHGGSIAQDWLGKADSFLSQDNDGFYSINYGALALCSAITIAREVVKHEDRIAILEKENARLKARVDELEERRT